MRIRAVVPVLDEASALPRLLPRLSREVDEIVVVDGGSTDGSVALARRAGAIVLQAARGRGPQLDAGAVHGDPPDLLWFVHADTRLPDGPGQALRAASAPWGCFAVELDDPDPRLGWTGRLMTRRARRSGSCTGDMGIWARPDLWRRAGGFGALPAFEDLAFSDRARALAPWQVLSPALGIDPRHWHAQGITRTVLRLWGLRGAYRLGIPADRLSAAWPSRTR
ncbi:MAG: glycosyltransferase family 2 protein [Alphaproteobacteria bacterium]|nr:glycosyltransferase family 2 protein [Alphaproteobacteria bacterium]